MLVITRRQSEVVHIGDDVTVTIVHTNGNKVRLGICAPHGTHILRDDAQKRGPKEEDTDDVQTRN
jgi:carbon storage regulator